MEALGTSNEHKRYQIAFRIYRMIAMMEKRSYTMNEIAKEFGVTSKTARRMMNGLKTMGVPFFNESHGRWRILK
jgi:predicted DNA-binding transcriptional regulator YafY